MVGFPRFHPVVVRAFAACTLAALVVVVPGCSDTTTAATVTAALSNITLSTSTVVGGTSVVGTVALTAIAPTGGAAVTLTSSSAAAVVPSAVTIPAGSTSLSFAITTTPVAATDTITATYLATSQAATLTVTVVTVPVLQSLVLSSGVTAGGAPLQGTVTLTAPAPAGGLTISLSSNNALAHVPASVTIPSGNISQTFQIDTTGGPSPVLATIIANYGGVTQTAGFTIGVIALSVPVASVPGGLAVTGTISLPAPAPGGGTAVALSSNSPSASVPSTVIVAPGATSQTFTINTANAPPTTTATITASYSGASQSATLTVVAYPSILVVSCSPTTPSGGATVQCTGTLSGPSPPQGWKLLGASSDPSVTVPAITVPPSSTTFQFAMTTTAVTVLTTVTVQLYDAQSGLPLWGQAISVTP
jgi:trimeric autotransporter adhesin